MTKKPTTHQNFNKCKKQNLNDYINIYVPERILNNPTICSSSAALQWTSSFRERLKLITNYVKLILMQSEKDTIWLHIQVTQGEWKVNEHLLQGLMVLA